ncbi:MAG: Zn-dependent exopeptidase M28 [Clostridium lundense]|nr:Zn-dependent exopeptidase M28 [Clostridium lundense]
MFKKFLYYCTTLFLIVFYFSFNLFINIKPFESYNVLKTIETLSSDKYKGRLAGTLENTETAAFVKEQFQKNNLVPFYDNYYQFFNVKYPMKVEGTPILKVINTKGDVLKEYSYGTDYKEDLLNFNENKVIFSKNESFFKDDFIKVDNGSTNVVFYVPEGDNLSFRSSFMHDAPMDMYIIITSSTKKDLERYIGLGYMVECFIPFEVKQASIPNVVAKIEGKKPNYSPIVLGAHFDHLGNDLQGNLYGGALDNASGIAFVIEMSKYLKSLGVPDKDLAFVGFNAEEFGLLGSAEFVKKYKPILTESKVFNFDMIGTNNSAPLCIMGGKEDTVNNSFIKSAAGTCTRNKIFFNYLFDDSSDHSSFRKENIDAITFIDNDTTRIHTPNDKASFISLKNIDRCFNVVYKEVIKYAFGNNPLYFYYKQILITSAFLILISLFILSKIKKRSDNKISK